MTFMERKAIIVLAYDYGLSIDCKYTLIWGFSSRDKQICKSHLYSYVSKHTYGTRLWPRTLLNPE